jgi:RNA polymerase subunit RPABC4/transcription elongation factor Spt4
VCPFLKSEQIYTKKIGLAMIVNGNTAAKIEVYKKLVTAIIV